MNSISTLDMMHAWNHLPLFQSGSYRPIGKAFQKLEDHGIIVYAPFQFTREMKEWRGTEYWQELLDILS